MGKLQMLSDNEPLHCRSLYHVTTDYSTYRSTTVLPPYQGIYVYTFWLPSYPVRSPIHQLARLFLLIYHFTCLPIDNFCHKILLQPVYTSANFNVFRITAMCGDYYIGGREFDTLSDLIGYYTCYSDLLKGERLQHPVPPPEVNTLLISTMDSLIPTL